jgi:primosomal protein N' (replication factor Y)
MEVPVQCPHCQSSDLEMRGFGTEKVEEYLQVYFPQTRIARLDLDTTRSKTGYQNIIADFENRDTDILVGTQMVTKGLNFDRVSVVGILNADHLISFPDFRSFERAFQTISQVSGRAGRGNIPGKVIIQTFRPEHPALQYVLTNNYSAMYQHQIAERYQYVYPPFCRLIKLTVKHKNENAVNQVAAELAVLLRQSFSRQVLGPEFPLVARIQNLYQKDLWIKMPKNQQLESQKQNLRKILDCFMQNSSYKTVRIIVNVDA